MLPKPLVDHDADRLEEPPNKAQAAGGVKTKLIDPSPPSGGRPHSGPSPFLVAAAALALGILAAKIVDWRSHAHPRA